MKRFIFANVKIQKYCAFLLLIKSIIQNVNIKLNDNHKKSSAHKKVCALLGGEGETRTPAPVTRPTPLAGAPRHQLEYFSVLLNV